jgi:hemoglobin
MREITCKEDIAELVDCFYDRVFKNKDLAPFFRHIDYPVHRPKMIHFWSFVLLDEPDYTTQVYDQHAKMRFDPKLFQVWVDLFCQTVDDLFVGNLSEQAKLRARTMGWTFAEKFKVRKDD